VVLATRTAANAAALQTAIVEQGGESMFVELDLVAGESISNAFAQIREQAGDPDVLVYNRVIWKDATFRRKRNY